MLSPYNNISVRSGEELSVQTTEVALPLGGAQHQQVGLMDSLGAAKSSLSGAGGGAFRPAKGKTITQQARKQLPPLTKQTNYRVGSQSPRSVPTNRQTPKT